MRKVIYAINITLDGCCDHTKMIPDGDLFDYHTQLVRDADLLVFGRKTYQLMVPYWPDIAKNPPGETKEDKADVEFAEAFCSKRIIVFSKSLDRAEGENTTIVRANLRDEILKLKEEQGKYILAGGVDIPSQLAELGLIDEFRFTISPKIAGEGRRLLEDVSQPEKLKFRLAESKTFESGSLVLRYLKQ
jgi:dihydrofolate reductase